MLSDFTHLDPPVELHSYTMGNSAQSSGPSLLETSFMLLKDLRQRKRTGVCIALIMNRHGAKNGFAGITPKLIRQLITYIYPLNKRGGIGPVLCVCA